MAQCDKTTDSFFGDRRDFDQSSEIPIESHSFIMKLHSFLHAYFLKGKLSYSTHYTDYLLTSKILISTQIFQGNAKGRFQFSAQDRVRSGDEIRKIPVKS